MSTESTKATTPSHDEDAAELAALGYKQELHRGLSGFSNFAVSFSIISILAGCITSFNIAMKSGGPVAITIGWPLVGIFVLCVALAMAEICSKYPTAGGLYFWAGRLAKPGVWNLGKWSALVGWIAVVWVAIIIVLFVLPPFADINVDTFNYSPIAVAVVAILAIVLWYAYGKRDFMTQAEAEHLTKNADELLEE